MMRKRLAVAFLGLAFFFPAVARAELVTVVDRNDNSSSSSQGNQDTNVVDLSDKDTNQPVQSPSFENTTPAGQAPGQPIENSND